MPSAFGSATFPSGHKKERLSTGRGWLLSSGVHTKVCTLNILDFQLETAMPSSKKPSMTIIIIIAIINVGKTMHFSPFSQN